MTRTGEKRPREAGDEEDREEKKEVKAAEAMEMDENECRGTLGRDSSGNRTFDPQETRA